MYVCKLGHDLIPDLGKSSSKDYDRNINIRINVMKFNCKIQRYSSGDQNINLKYSLF